MDARQLKMARVALGLTVRQAAETCDVSHDTITRLEAGQELKESTAAKVRTALEAAGVEFIPENGGGAGVRLRRRAAADQPGPKPVGPATDAVDAMEAAIEGDKAKRKPSAAKRKGDTR